MSVVCLLHAVYVVSHLKRANLRDNKKKGKNRKGCCLFINALVMDYCYRKCFCVLNEKTKQMNGEGNKIFKTITHFLIAAFDSFFIWFQ